MFSTLLASGAVTLAGLLPLPLPTAPGTGSEPQAQQVPVSGSLSADDGRLRKGCRPYRYAYAIDTGTEDWTFDITLQDRSGKGVNAQSLLGPNDEPAGILDYRLCRWATTPGRFILTGSLTAYEGTWRETTVTVTESFRLRKRRR